MSYANLPQAMQDLVLVNTEMFLKIFFLFVMFASCFFYIKTFKPRQNSPYLGVRVLRGLLYYSAYAYMFMSPLTAFLLYPEVSIEIVMQIVLMVYTILIFVIGMIVMVNLPFYGAHFLFDMLGIDNDFNKMNKNFKDVFGNNPKHLTTYRNTSGSKK